MIIKKNDDRKRGYSNKHLYFRRLRQIAPGFEQKARMRDRYGRFIPYGNFCRLNTTLPPILREAIKTLRGVQNWTF